jgi:pimeloyl-ACP methyl ester carboxylesterase
MLPASQPLDKVRLEHHTRERVRPYYAMEGKGQVRYWRGGEGNHVLVLSGLVASASTAAQKVLAARPDVTVTAFSLPSVLAVLENHTDTSLEALATLFARLARRLAPACSIVATDLAIPLARRVRNELDKQLPVMITIGSSVAQAAAARALVPPFLDPQTDGTHLVSLWHHLRDCSMLEPPGFARARRAGDAYPSPDELHEALLEFGADPIAYTRLWDILANAAEDDAARPVDPDEIPCESMEQLSQLHLVEARTGDSASNRLPAVATSLRAWKDYVPTRSGRMHVRRSGKSDEAVILLHSAPGSAAPLMPVLTGLSERFAAIAPDYFGNGESDKPVRETSIATLADDILQLADALELETFHLWGSHTGAKIALAVARAQPERVNRIVLDGLSLISDDFRSDVLKHYLPPIQPDRWGLHLQQAWHMRRDMFMFWPWYRQEAATARRGVLPDVATLHAWTIGLLQSGHTYDRSYRAAFECDAKSLLPHVKHPTLLCVGPDDMFLEHLKQANYLVPPSVTVQRTPATVWYPGQDPDAVKATLDIYIRHFLDEKEPLRG